MDDFYEDEPSNPAIEFVTVEPEYLEEHLMDDMEIEDVKDLPRMVSVLPQVRPHINPKIIKKKIIRVQYSGRGKNDVVLKQNKLKPSFASPNDYLVKRAKKITIPLPKDLCIALISRVEKEPCIWDSTSKHSRNKTIKEKAWNRIANHLEMPVEILKAKWTSLLGSYRSYNSRYKKGQHADGKPAWFAYDLLSFLSNEIESTLIDEQPELSSDWPKIENYTPDTISGRHVQNRSASPPDAIQKYEEETLLPSDTAPITIHNNSTADDRDATDYSDISCNAEILRIVRSMSKVLNKMANIGMAVDYGRYVNQHLREYDDEIRRKTVKGIMDLITAADEEMSLKYPDRAKVPGNGSANPHKK